MTSNYYFGITNLDCSISYIPFKNADTKDLNGAVKIAKSHGKIYAPCMYKIYSKGGSLKKEGRID